MADRIKISRKGRGLDVVLSVQYLLNCGAGVAGSCHGGSHSGTYQFIHDRGFVPFNTCMQYEACSSDSLDQACRQRDFSCTADNTCRTCFIDFEHLSTKCSHLDVFPNATVAEYGHVAGEANMKAEIWARGPIACSINARPLSTYQSGVLDKPNGSKTTNHVVSIVGWGEKEGGADAFWIVRNSWGEYFGELGFFRLKRGSNQLGIEDNCSWATPGSFTEMNFPCFEDGSNCVHQKTYVDPHRANPAAIEALL